MQDDIAPVLQDPRTLLVPFRGRRIMTAGFHLDTNFVSEGVHLPSAGSGRDDEKIHDRCHASQIKDNRVFAAVFLTDFGDMAGIFQAALQPRLRGGIGDDGGNGEAPRAIKGLALVVREAD